MSNEPGTYYALITFPDVTGEESDSLISFAEYWINEHVHETATVVHLTPETLPDRYVERWKLERTLEDLRTERAQHQVTLDRYEALLQGKM